MSLIVFHNNQDDCTQAKPSCIHTCSRSPLVDLTVSYTQSLYHPALCNYSKHAIKWGSPFLLISYMTLYLFRGSTSTSYHDPNITTIMIISFD